MRAARLGLVGLVAAAATFGVGCGDDDPESVDVSAACDHLAAVGEAILDARDASSAEEVAEAVGPAMRDFVTAARDSGDDRLGELASTAAERFEVYLTDDTLDGREAGNDADVALDRSTERCLQLGATNDFPEQPGS